MTDKKDMILSNFLGNPSNNKRHWQLKGVDWNLEFGFAVLEAAGAMVVLLPLLLLGVGVAIMLHDQSVYRAAPGEALRRVAAPMLRFNSDNTGGLLSFSEQQAKGVAVGVVKQMGQAVSGQAVMMTQPSFRVCVWLVGVNTATGQYTRIDKTICHEAGIAGAKLGFTEELNEVLKGQIGVPLVDGSGRFASSAVLFGAKVAAKSDKSIVGVKTPDLEYGVVQSPRGEITI